MIVGEAAALLARCAGGDIPVVQFTEEGAVGMDLLPEAAYVLLVQRAEDINGAVRALTNCCMVRTLAVITPEMPLPHQLTGLNESTTLAMIHISPDAFVGGGNEHTIRAGLAVARELLPPFAGVLYLPSSETVGEALALVQRVVGPTSPLAAATTTTDISQPKVSTSMHVQEAVLNVLEPLVDAESMQQVAEGHPLMAAGVSSTLAVQLVSGLEDALGRDLPGTLVFDYPTLPELSEFLSRGGDVSPGGAHDHLPTTPSEQTTQYARYAALDFTPSPAAHGVLPSRGAALHLEGRMHSKLVSTILQSVRDLVGDEAGPAVGPETPLMSAGVTSTLAVQLVSALEAALGIELPGTLVFDYPTASAIAAAYAQSTQEELEEGVLRPAELVSFESKRRPVHVITASSHAISGGSLRYRVTGGNDRIRMVPLERWDVDTPSLDAPLELNLQFGSFLEDVASFDAAAFAISPAEAVLMDPQQRLALDSFAQSLAVHSTSTFASTGGDSSSARPLPPPRDTGVFVGISQLDYARIAYETGSALNTYYATGSHLSVAAGRMAYTFALRGPAVAVDTACSSSLVTTHLAARALDAGDCSVAGSVGVNLALVHSWTMACLRAGMLSEDGRCKTLDASAGDPSPHMHARTP